MCNSLKHLYMLNMHSGSRSCRYKYQNDECDGDDYQRGGDDDDVPMVVIIVALCFLNRKWPHTNVNPSLRKNREDTPNVTLLQLSFLYYGVIKTLMVQSLRLDLLFVRSTDI